MHLFDWTIVTEDDELNELIAERDRLDFTGQCSNDVQEAIDRKVMQLVYRKTQSDNQMEFDFVTDL